MFDLSLTNMTECLCCVNYVEKDLNDGGPAVDFPLPHKQGSISECKSSDDEQRKTRDTLREAA